MNDRVVLITGGAKGIGFEYSKAFHRNGYKVAIADIDKEAINRAVNAIDPKEENVFGVQVDVSDFQSVTKMVEMVLHKYNTIDVLVNNAALYAVLQKKPFENIDTEEWDKVMAVNVRGVFNCCKAVFSVMKSKDEGRIINITSDTVQLGIVGFLHYVSSKGAIIGLTHALSREIGEYGITVNAVSPGLTRTETNDCIPLEYFEESAKQCCIKRIQTPGDCANAVLFLASKESSFISGQNIFVNGGRVMS